MEKLGRAGIRSHSKKSKRGRADKALQEVVEQERERGEVNTWAEPDQKSEIRKRGETD